MQRPNFRFPANAVGSSPGRFRSPPPGFVGGQGGIHSPPWQFGGGPPSPFGPRFNQFGGSPNTSPGEFSSGDDGFRRDSGSSGKSWQQGTSPNQYTPRRPYDKHRGGSTRHSPFQSPSPRHGGYQGSPRTSTPFRSPRGRGGAVNIERFYKPSMVQDPWANLGPISVKDVQKKCGVPQTTASGLKSRYY